MLISEQIAQQGTAGTYWGHLNNRHLWLRFKTKTHRGEAEDHMQVLSGSRNEVLVEIVKGGRVARELPLHHRDQTLGDLIQLVTRKQIGDLWATDKKMFCMLRVLQPIYCHCSLFFSPLCVILFYIFFLHPDILISQRLLSVIFFIAQLNQEQIMPFPCA